MYSICNKETQTEDLAGYHVAVIYNIVITEILILHL